MPLFNLAYPKTVGVIEAAELERLMKEFWEILAPRGIPGSLFVRTDLHWRGRFWDGRWNTLKTSRDGCKDVG